MHNENTSKIEALLFAVGEPVSIEKISKHLKLSKKDCEEEVVNLMNIYKQIDGGLQLIKHGSGHQLASSSKYGEMISAFLKRGINEPLSKAAVEVLSVIAYRGPMTRAQIEHIRGVNCSFTLRNLAIKGLIERAENALDNRSYVYNVSIEFIKSMGIDEVTKLPDYEQLHDQEIAVEKKAGELALKKMVSKETKNEK